MKKLTIFKNSDTGKITGAVFEYNNKFITFDEAEANELMVKDYLSLEPNTAVGNLIIPLNRIQTIEEQEN